MAIWFGEKITIIGQANDSARNLHPTIIWGDDYATGSKKNLNLGYGSLFCDPQDPGQYYTWELEVVDEN